MQVKASEAREWNKEAVCLATGTAAIRIPGRTSQLNPLHSMGLFLLIVGASVNFTVIELLNYRSYY